MRLCYDWPNECMSIWTWAYHSWDFLNSDPEFRNREWGIRIFGVVLTNYDDHY